MSFGVPSAILRDLGKAVSLDARELVEENPVAANRLCRRSPAVTVCGSRLSKPELNKETAPW